MVYLVDTIEPENNLLCAYFEGSEYVKCRVYPPEDHNSAGSVYVEIKTKDSDVIHRATKQEWEYFLEEYEGETGATPYPY